MAMLIAGIDPGTTTGIAALDLGGRLLLLTSLKNADRSMISKAIIDTGRPLIIAGDVAPASRLLEKLAAAFSARIFSPEKSMDRLGKIEVAERYSKAVSPDEKLWKNRHERDALAAALRAWKSLRPVIARISEASAGMDSRSADRLAECVLLGGRPVGECRRKIARD
jgi:predicted RNase H-like nuclease (RuvC/YqgF family)